MTDNNHDRYVLVKVTDPCDAISAGAVRDILADQYRQVTKNKPTFAATDVTDLVTYNKTTPGDPWDKPYPAMYAEMMERLQPS